MLHKTAQQNSGGVHEAHLKPILELGRRVHSSNRSSDVAVQKSNSHLVKLLDDGRIECSITNKAKGDILKELKRSHKPLMDSGSHERSEFLDPTSESKSREPNVVGLDLISRNYRTNNWRGSGERVNLRNLVNLEGGEAGMYVSNHCW